MTKLSSVALSALIVGLAGCVSMQGPQVVEEDISADPLTIVMPGDSTSAEELMALLYADDPKQWHDGSDNVRSTTFSHVGYDGAQLVARSCNGDLYMGTGQHYQSCVTIFSDVVAGDEPGMVEVTPVRKSVQEHGFIEVVDLPDFGVDHWYAMVANGLYTRQDDTYEYEYSRDALVANFERSFRVSADYDVNYDLTVRTDVNNQEVDVGADFRPYRSGSVVEYRSVLWGELSLDQRTLDFRTPHEVLRGQIEAAIDL